TMPKPRSGNTGSSTRKRKQSPFSDCVVRRMRKSVCTDAANRQRRRCCRNSGSQSPMYSTRIDRHKSLVSWAGLPAPVLLLGTSRLARLNQSFVEPGDILTESNAVHIDGRLWSQRRREHLLEPMASTNIGDWRMDK